MSICGILNIDKPEGLTSREVVDHVVRIVRPAKVGHAGTLDPLATGVLVVCVGHATRLIDLIHAGRKRYLARFELGRRSDTDDITGNVIEGGDWTSITQAQLESALSQFVGRIQQKPPQFSAVHVEGQRAYQLARKGQSFELAARPVDVFSIRIVDLQLPEVEVEIECGSGTYIRSIGRDLGGKLECGAVMTRLRRTAVSQFEVADAIDLDAINAEAIKQQIQPAITAVSQLPRRILTARETVDVRCGKSIPAMLSLPSTERQTVLVDPGGEMIGIAEVQFDSQTLQPRIIFPENK